MIFKRRNPGRYGSILQIYSAQEVSRNSSDIITAAKMLLGSKRPVIQAGQGVLYAEGQKNLWN
ncbi:MAG: hypothetical protein CM1200mP3_08750 [Chloroflexota bacterium]|nr:MAG: hypothetical protein CM1200mP3_08750 [Chloroflexota bacterium]